jgi:hypothetical protein
MKAHDGDSSRIFDLNDAPERAGQRAVSPPRPAWTGWRVSEMKTLEAT